MKNIIIFALSILLMSNLLCSCSNTEKTDFVDSSVPAEDSQFMTIKWCSIYDDLQLNMRENEITEELEKTFNVDFILMGSSYNQYYSYIGSKLTKQDVPDVFILYARWQLDKLTRYCAEITVEEIRGFMPDYFVECEKIFDEMGYQKGKKWESYTLDGKLYSVPMVFPISTWALPRVSLWRKDILDKLKLPIPTTIGEWENVFRTYLMFNPDSKPITTSLAWGYSQSNFVFEAMGLPYMELVEKDGEVIDAAQQPEVRIALQTLQNWVEKGYIRDLWRTPQAHKPYQDFIDGENIVATSITPVNGNWICEKPYWPESLQAQCLEKNPDAEFVISPPPVFDGSSKPWFYLYDKISYRAIVFGKHLEEDREKLHRIMRMLNRMATDPEIFLLTNFGIEGKEWEWKKDKGEKYPMRLPKEDGKPRSTETSYWSVFYTEKNSKYLVPPSIRDSIDQNCMGMDSPYSRFNTIWYFDHDFFPFDDAEIERFFDNYWRSYYRPMMMLSRDILVSGKNVDAWFEEYPDLYNTTEGQQMRNKYMSYKKEYMK